jgi:hypothetical protein
MRLAWILAGLSLSAAIGAAQGAPDVWGLELRGEAAQAQARLQQAAAAPQASAAAVRAWAEFLDRYRDPGARAAYGRLAQILERDRAASAEKIAVYRRLAALDLLAGDRDAATRDVASYTTAGGSGLTLAPVTPAAAGQQYIEIPGPLQSFARMAALAQDLKPDEILPALARNVVTNGYQAVNSAEGLDQTEYLKLTIRYLSQARELAK